MTAKASTVRKKTAFVTAHEGLLYCRNCGTAKPSNAFWDSKKRKPMKTCSACLSRRRNVARLRKGKSVHQSRAEWWQNYNDYLASDAWAAKKAEYWAKGKHKNCYVCGARRHPGMQLHHRTYERMGHEDLNDLVPVCEPCHDKITKFSRAHRKTMTLWQATDAVALARRV